MLHPVYVCVRSALWRSEELRGAYRRPVFMGEDRRGTIVVLEHVLQVLDDELELDIKGEGLGGV